MDEKDWLKNLKVGDKVYVSGTYGRVGNVGTVIRFTKTLIIVTCGSYEKRYKKTSGYIYGGNVWSTYGNAIRELTQEKLDLMRIESLKSKAIGLRDNLLIPQTEKELNDFIEALKPFTSKGK